MTTVKYGIIGAGKIAEKFVNACDIAEGAEVISVASRNLENAQDFAQKLHIKHAYGSYQELVDDKEVQAVYIAVINTGHFPAIEMAAKAGKAILCEKPAILTKKESIKLQELLKETNVLFMEALWSIFLPAIQMAKKWIIDERIGSVKSIDTTFSFYGDKKPGSRLFEKDLGGGGLLDVGVYCIGFCMYITETDPLDVKSIEYIGDTQVDEFGTVLLRFPNNIIAEGHYGVRLHRPTVALIYGENGYIKIDNFFNGQKIYLYNRQNELLDTFVSEHSNGFTFEIEHFTQLYLTGEKESNIHPISRSLAYADIYDKVKKQR